MSLINEDEIKRLRTWACENKNEDVFAQEREQKESLWKTKKRQDTYIMEYDFQTISEFEKICGYVFEKEIDRNIQRTLSVAVFKHSKDHELSQEEKEKLASKLPEHIYVF